MIEERYIRFVHDGAPRWGIRRGRTVDVLSASPWTIGCVKTGANVGGDVALLAPAEPTKIIALGYNYKDLFADPAARTSAREPHYLDAGFEPVVFLKGPNCVASPDASVGLTLDTNEAWVEVEVAAVL